MTTYKYILSYALYGYANTFFTTEFVRDTLITGEQLAEECCSHLDQIGMHRARPTSVTVDKIFTERIIAVEL